MITSIKCHLGFHKHTKWVTFGKIENTTQLMQIRKCVCCKAKQYRRINNPSQLCSLPFTGRYLGGFQLEKLNN